MHIIDLCWHLKSLLGKVLIEKNEAWEEILLQLDEIQVLSRSMDYKLSKIEAHLGLSPTPAC